MSLKTNNQTEAFEKLSKLKVGALFMEMGTGKTKVALDLMNSKQSKVDYNLWICPCSLKNEIESELCKWHPHMKLDIVGCESISSSDRIYLETLQKVKENKTFIIVDESLKIKNIRAKRTRRILELGQYSQYRIILNGTPLSKNILDIWAQMEFLSHKILNMDYRQFKDTYCEYYTQGKLKGKVRKQVNIPHLISLIEPYIYECKLNIETRKYHHYYSYQIYSYDEYNEYKYELFNEYYNDTSDEFNFNAFAMKLQRYYCNESNRRERIEEIISEVDGKTIVFVRYLDSIPDNAKRITGAEKQSERKKIIDDFKQGKFNVIYITYGCGAYGLNLQFCKNIIFAEQVWDYALQIQAEARIYRMGQGKEVNYYHLICQNIGLEKLMSQCIERKSTLLDTVKTEISNQKGGIKEWVKNI